VTYAEALALAEKAINKMPESYLALTFSYNRLVVLPFDEGLSLLKVLKKATCISTSYDKAPVIAGFSEDILTFRAMSADEFGKYHMAQLLNVHTSEIDRLKDVPF
jgi:hypothetical protein